MAVKAGAGPLIGRGKDPERYSDDELRSHLRSNRFILARQAEEGAAAGEGEGGKAKGGNKGSKGSKGCKGLWKGGSKEHEADDPKAGAAGGQKRGRPREADSDAPVKRTRLDDLLTQADEAEAFGDEAAAQEQADDLAAEAEEEEAGELMNFGVDEEAGVEEQTEEDGHQPWHFDGEVVSDELQHGGEEIEGLPQHGDAEFWEEAPLDGAPGEGEEQIWGQEEYAGAEAPEEGVGSEVDGTEAAPAEEWYEEDAMAAGAQAEEWPGGDVQAEGVAEEEWFEGNPSEVFQAEDASLVDDTTALDRIMAQ